MNNYEYINTAESIVLADPTNPTISTDLSNDYISELKKNYPNLLLTTSFVDMKNIVVNHMLNAKWSNLNLIDTTNKTSENYYIKTYMKNVRLFEISLELDYDRESFLTNNRIRNGKNIIIIDIESDLLKHINRLKTMIRYLFIIIDNRKCLTIIPSNIDLIFQNDVKYKIGY
jgi:hypothetical protein